MKPFLIPGHRPNAGLALVLLSAAGMLGWLVFSEDDAAGDC
jgi:hypothetical protein